MQFIGDLLRTEMLQTAVIWDLHLQEGLCQTVEHLLLLLPLEVCPEMLSVYLI